MMTNRRVRCRWTNVEERERDPTARVYTCRRYARWLSCLPWKNTPTCSDHRCECAVPYKVAAGKDSSKAVEKDSKAAEKEKDSKVTEPEPCVGRLYFEDLYREARRQLSPGAMKNPHAHLDIGGCRNHPDSGLMVCFYPRQGELVLFCIGCGANHPPLMVVPPALRPN